MAEAGIAAFGAAAGVAITMAIVLFALRGKGHPEPVEGESTPEPAKEEPTPEPAKEEPKTEE